MNRLLPPFLAGVAAAISLVTSAGLLLYSGDGFLSALTLILTVETGSLGLGLWSGGGGEVRGRVERVRRGWLFCLVAFSLAAATAAGLSFVDGLAGSGLGQGVGLALLGGLPLFTIGSLLGIMAQREPAGDRPLPLIGAPAALGAAVGFFLAGDILIPNAEPYTLFILALIALSGGALLQGTVLDDWLVLTLVDSRTRVEGPDLRMESRALGGQRDPKLVLLEGGVVRGAEDGAGRPALAWQRAVLEWIDRSDTPPGTVLLLGGGGGTLARCLGSQEAPWRITIVERSEELVRLARNHFLHWDGWDEVDWIVGEPLAWIETSPSTFDLVVVDAGALPSLAGLPFLQPRELARFTDLIEPNGVFLMGGLPGVSGPGGLSQLVAEGRALIPHMSLHQEVPGTEDRRMLPEIGNKATFFLAASKQEEATWPMTVQGFLPLPLPEV